MISLVLLTGGALWLRASIADMDQTRVTARIDGGWAVLSALEDTVRAGNPLPDLKTPYEIVGANGRFLPSNNRDVRDLQEIFGQPVVRYGEGFPGVQVVRTAGLDVVTETKGYQWPAWTAVTETIPTPPGQTERFGDRVRINVFVTRPDENPLPELDRVLWPSVPGAALLIAFVAWIAARQALRPIERIRLQTAAVTATSLDRRIPLPRSWFGRWSIGARAAVAAGLIAAGPFIGGVLWLRHTIDEIYTARMMANSEAFFAAGEALAVASPLGKSIPPSDSYVITGGVVTERRTVNPAPGLDRVLWPGVPAGVALVGFTAWAATTRALVPVERIRKQVKVITAHKLDVRVPVPPTRDAITNLAVTLNETLDRLEKSVAAQRQFIADAAHELRSPIASLRTVLEVAADHPDRADWPAVVRDAVTDTQRLQDLAEDLLLLARLDSAQPQRVTELDLTELVKSEAAGRATLNTNGPATMTGNPAQLTRLLRNLVDNAERHAATEVTVSVLSTPLAVTVEVTDDGLGIAPEDRERVFERFTRLDESRDSASGGAGLGLAIAREIAHANGGTLVVSDRSPGATFVASFVRS
ncbi:signal transduction histidine kinase [Actinocrispum wychmicini]|uniref:histidine kinase n=2 Tax=Actinocrispum wychmicini TaxID=1213861 RepID=A0A4R2INB4_9PSEU|nr:signal transduction histidine kinase [Actinocrispum wychmicini]